LGSSGTSFGGFGALGGGNSFSYLWAGSAYNDAALYLYASPGNYAVSPGSFRAPIFYDSNDTGYYFDGNGGTRQSKFLTINGNIGGNNGNELVVGNTAVTYSLTDTNLRPIIQAHGAYPVLTLNHTITANTLHGPTVQFTANGTGKQFVIGMSGNGSQLDIGNSAATDWNPHNGIGGYNGITGWRMDTSGNVYNFISTRSPIFYDTNDTGYYIDPTGTSFTNGMRSNVYRSLYGGGQPAARWDCSFYVLQAQHWYSHNGASTMYVGESGDFVYIRGYTTAEGSSRAPIFYDSNNTGYYLDPNGGSNVNTIYADSWFRSYGDSGWFSQTHGGGIFMQDTTWVRVYNGKAFYVPNEIAATGNITAYYSDERLKTKTGGIDNALEKVVSLSGFLYVENDLARSLGYTNAKQQVGVSAQAVQAVLPEAVSLAPVDFETLEDGTIISKSGENYLTVDYSRLVPLLIEAIKELRNEVITLKTTLN
jgi:hypothetical protein